LVENLGESEAGAYGVAVGAGVGGEKEAGVGAEDGQERGDLGLMALGFMALELMNLGLKQRFIDTGLRREGLTKVGRGSVELQELGFGFHGLAVTG
jgi:hypothetical protein